MHVDPTPSVAVPEEVPSTVSVARREALLRGPPILVAVSRVLLIPFYFVCAVGASNDLWKLWPRLRLYSQTYLAGKFLLAAGMWVLMLLSLLLAWLFFSRRRAFRPLMIYFCCLFLLLLVRLVVHARRFPPSHRSPPPSDPWFPWFAGVIIAFTLSSFFWPFYYAFSPRVRRVFTR